MELLLILDDNATLLMFDLKIQYLLAFFQILKPLKNVLSCLVDQEASQQLEHDNLSSEEMHRSYAVDEFEVRILEPEKSGGSWETRSVIHMQSYENALTVRMVSLFVS